MTGTGTSNDVTTWKVALIGNPVHLVYPSWYAGPSGTRMGAPPAVGCGFGANSDKLGQD